MPKTRQQKEQVVSDLANKLKSAKALFVVAPNSINPNEAAELKIKLGEIGGEYHLIKNSLFARALTEIGLDVDTEFSQGQNAVVFVGDQSPEAAKIISTFIKDTEKAQFKSGFLDSQKISAADVQILADLPSRDQLLAQVLATMNAPLTGFVRVLAGNVRSIINVVDAYQKSKEA